MLKRFRNTVTSALGVAAIICFGIAGHFHYLTAEFAVSGWVLIVLAIAVAIM